MIMMEAPWLVEVGLVVVVQVATFAYFFGALTARVKENRENADDNFAQIKHDMRDIREVLFQKRWPSGRFRSADDK